MKQLGKVLTQTSWSQASNTINLNSDKVYESVTQLENVAFKHKGYFMSSSALLRAYPNPNEGYQAFVFNSENSSDAQFDIWGVRMLSSSDKFEWYDTGMDGGNVVPKEIVEFASDAYIEERLTQMDNKIPTFYTENKIQGTADVHTANRVTVSSGDGATYASVELKDGKVEFREGEKTYTFESIIPKYYSEWEGNAAILTAPEQVVLRVGDFTDEESPNPFLSVGSSINEIRLSSNNDEAYLVVQDDAVSFKSKGVEKTINDIIPSYYTEDVTKQNAQISPPKGLDVQSRYVVLSDNTSACSIGIYNDHILLAENGKVARLGTIIPTAIHQKDIDDMKANNTWDGFMSENPLIYVIEE